jgi:hypothetical protein
MVSKKRLQSRPMYSPYVYYTHYYTFGQVTIGFQRNGVHKKAAITRTVTGVEWADKNPHSDTRG